MEQYCPYCKGELKKGYIHTPMSLRWSNEDDGWIGKSTMFGNEILSRKDLIYSYRCKDCEKIIIDLKEVKLRAW